ncbi:MAG TPA: EAL domain-containing protein [Thermoanaerobaculia bacterium]|nr:EAL domain-containing protein [Thermoanaerobaculia bacterium]
MNIRPSRLPRPLATLVQPIVDLSAGAVELFAVECLTRGPRGSRLEAAPPLFEYIRRRGLEREMDRACIALALREAAALQCRITLNVHPGTLTDGFVPFLLDQSRRAGIDPSHLIVEVGEQTPCTDAAAFRRALAALRQHGIGIAVDDVGYGYSNLRAILDCRPDYLKIDRYFIEKIDSDPARVAVVESILGLARYFGARVIAEGVERRDELEVLRLLGIDLVQGFYFSRPAAISSDGAQHALVDRVLQDDAPLEQTLVEARIDVARERHDAVGDDLHGDEERPVEGLRLRPFERLEREAAADQIGIE